MGIEDQLEKLHKQIEAEKATLNLKKQETTTEVVNHEESSSIAQDTAETTEDSGSLRNSPEVEEREYTDIEKQAMEMGWKPDHKGANFVDAKEFVYRGSFFKKIDEQNKVIKELIDHNKRVEEVSYKRGIQEALAKRQEAVSIGDTRAFNEAEKQLVELQQNKPAFVETKPQIDADGKAFLDRNKDWFNKDTTENTKMQNLAIAYGDFLQKENPNMPPAEILKTVEESIKSLPQFKHRFENTQSSKPALVTRSTVSTGSKSQNLSSRLSDSQKEIFRACKRLDPSLDIEKYAKQLDMTGRLQKK